MSDSTHGSVKIGHLVPMHTYISHKTGSKLFSWLIEVREKGVFEIQRSAVSNTNCAQVLFGKITVKEEPIRKWCCNVSQ